MNSMNIINLENMKHRCRICLRPNNKVIALTCKLDEYNDESPQISDVLENIFSTKVNTNSNYPRGICLSCNKNIQISYGLKMTFKKSQHILEKYVTHLNLQSLNNHNNFESSQSAEALLDEEAAEDNHMGINSKNNHENLENSEYEEDIDNRHLLESYCEDKNIDILENHPEHCFKQELSDEETSLNDFVILEVTDDNEDDGIKLEPDDYIDEACANFNVTAEFFGPNRQYTIEKIIPKFKIKEDRKVISQFFESNKCMEKNIVQESELEGNMVKSLDQSNLIRKIVSESKLSYDCPFCNKHLLSKRTLEKHTRICQKYPLERCDYCDQQFSSVTRKHYHIKMKHSSTSKQVICQVCDEVFESLRARSYHIRTKHAVKKFTCKVCDKAFHFKSGLTTHMETHTKDKFREICPECGKGFHYRGGLFYHMKIHRGERNYLCTYCSARFLNISGLKKHILTHTGEKPCQCEYCGKSFRSTSILKKHEKTHTGHRPHSCVYCGKGFITAYNLKVHMAGHSGDCPCEFCDKSFLNQEVLNLHMKFKHNIKKDIMKMAHSE